MNAVFDKRGQRGRLLNESNVAVSGTATLQLPDGREVHVPAAWLQPRPGGDYYLPADFEQIREQTAEAQAGESFKVPLIEETLDVHTRETQNVVRLRKVAREYEEVLRQPVFREEVEIERVPLNQPVTEPVSARQEGDTLIIPLVEEEIVWQRRLVVREEIRVRKRRTEEQTDQRVSLRREELLLERDRDKESTTDKR